MAMSDVTLPPETAEQFVSACRAAIGDHLRAVVHFTPETTDVLYLRSDLRDHPEQVREERVDFVEYERVGFLSQEAYDRFATKSDGTPDIGTYEFTIRVFSDGFVSRVIVGDHGVLLTTDSMNISDFEELSVTLRRLLANLE